MMEGSFRFQKRPYKNLSICTSPFQEKYLKALRERTAWMLCNITSDSDTIDEVPQSVYSGFRVERVRICPVERGTYAQHL